MEIPFFISPLLLPASFPPDLHISLPAQAAHSSFRPRRARLTSELKSCRTWMCICTWFLCFTSFYKKCLINNFCMILQVTRDLQLCYFCAQCFKCLKLPLFTFSPGQCSFVTCEFISDYLCTCYFTNRERLCCLCLGFESYAFKCYWNITSVFKSIVLDLYLKHANFFSYIELENWSISLTCTLFVHWMWS